jgi:hypothetical protein
MATARSAYHYRSLARLAEIEQLADRLAALAATLINESDLPPGPPPGWRLKP